MYNHFDIDDIYFRQRKSNNSIIELSKLEFDSKYFSSMSLPLEKLNTDLLIKPMTINDSISLHNFKYNDITKATNFEKFSEDEELEKYIFFIKKEKEDSISIFNEAKNSEERKMKELNNNLLRKKRGRKGTTGNHNKFSDDNLIRKCKHLILKNIFNFINEKISDVYENNIGNGIMLKKLLIINQKQKSDASIIFNKEFLNKSLGDIFSENISTRYSNYPPNHNKILIEFLKIDQKGNSEYFTRLFNLTFSECLNHFRGSKKIKELEGIAGIDSLVNEYNNDEKYLKYLNYHFRNYESIINNKRIKCKKKEKEINE